MSTVEVSSSTSTDQVDRPAAVERPLLLLAGAGQIAAQRFAEGLRATGMKPAHVGILINLRALAPIGQQALGERLRLEPSKLVSLLNALEIEGLATRRRDPSDRRRHLVEITDRGRERLEQAEDRAERIESDLLARLSDAEREQLRRLLGRVLTDASTPGGDQEVVIPELN
jgi:DNA-binding MarR family transcriptional regulator